MGFYLYRKHIQLSVMNENGKKNSVDLAFYHKVLLTFMVYWLHSLGKIKYVLIVKHGLIMTKHGWTLILDVMTDGSEYILVNIYNANTESKQLRVLNDLSKPVKKVSITHGNQFVLAGDFSLFLTVI